MKHLQTEIIIDAPKSTVWNVLTDFEAYQDWNPFVKTITGEQTVGSSLVIQLGLGEKPMTIKPNITTWENESQFAWLGHLMVPGIFDGNHYFKVEAISDTQTKFIHGERFSGILRGLIMRMVGKQTQAGFVAMNRAIKEQAEAKK